MVKQERTLAKRAEDLWAKRDLAGLAALGNSASARKVPQVLYYAGLALNALNKKRDALQCWRKATELAPGYDAPLRALAYELAETSPASAAELFYHLVGSDRANADDLTALAEIRIKQGLLAEASRLLQHALALDSDNSLTLLAMASVYAQVRDRRLALDYLQKAAQTEDIDLSEIAGDPEFEFLWGDPEFEQLIAAADREIA